MPPSVGAGTPIDAAGREASDSRKGCGRRRPPRARSVAGMHPDLRATPAAVFAVALGGATLTAVVDGSTRSHRLPVSRWAGRVTRGDRFVLERCRGATLDLGCGPGRLAAELAARGHEVLGVDLAPAAVARARHRGIRALQRDVFGALPHEGRWDTALLADGNIGIGGDPVALLRRARRLVHAGGRVVVDLAAPGTGLRVHRLHLLRRWAVVDTVRLGRARIRRGGARRCVRRHGGVGGGSVRRPLGRRARARGGRTVSGPTPAAVAVALALRWSGPLPRRRRGEGAGRG